MTKFKRGDTAILNMPEEKLGHKEWSCKIVVISHTYEDEDHKKYGLKKCQYLCNIINLSDCKIFDECYLDKCDLFRNGINN